MFFGAIYIEAMDLPVSRVQLWLVSELPSGVSYLVGYHGTVLDVVSTICKWNRLGCAQHQSSPLVDQPGGEGYGTSAYFHSDFATLSIRPMAIACCGRPKTVLEVVVCFLLSSQIEGP